MMPESGGTHEKTAGRRKCFPKQNDAGDHGAEGAPISRLQDRTRLLPRGILFIAWDSGGKLAIMPIIVRTENFITVKP